MGANSSGRVSFSSFRNFPTSKDEDTSNRTAGSCAGRHTEHGSIAACCVRRTRLELYSLTLAASRQLLQELSYASSTRAEARRKEVDGADGLWIGTANSTAIEIQNTEA